MDIKSINKDTVIDALVNRCDTLHKINLAQRSKLIKQDSIIIDKNESIGKFAKANEHNQNYY